MWTLLPKSFHACALRQPQSVICVVICPMSFFLTRLQTLEGQGPRGPVTWSQLGAQGLAQRLVLEGMVTLPHLIGPEQNGQGNPTLSSAVSCFMLFLSLEHWLSLSLAFA